MLSKRYIALIITLTVILIIVTCVAFIKTSSDCEKSGGHFEGLRYTRHCVK